MKRKIFFSIFAFILCFFGCKQAEKVPPAVPESNTYNIDLSYFSQPLSETGNYARAYATVNFWKILFEDSLFLQNKLYSSVAYKDPEYQDDNTWLISSEIKEGDNIYEVNFFEIEEIDTVFTKLFFSQDSIYENLLIFDGWFIPDSTDGFWQINKPDTGNTYQKYVKINRNIVSVSKKEMKAVYLFPDENNGNYILYKDSVVSGYDSYIDIFEKATENHIYIQYDKILNVGRVKDAGFFGDTLWHNWDENRQDI